MLLPQLVLALMAPAVGSVTFPATQVAPAIDGTLADPAWQSAAQVQLGYDLRTHQRAEDQTVGYVLTDANYIYVAVEAKQSAPVRAIQHTNDVGLDTDDEVGIYLWPNGPSGFRYQFIATPLGTHYEASSENALYQPAWTSMGKIVPGGFTVTMKIPLDVMHGAGQSAWRVQFARYVANTGATYVWNYGSAQQNTNDVHYAAPATGLPALAALRPKSRVGVYALGAVSSKPAGGSTSRVGADVSVPLFSGTSLFATFHPDFSDVEQDQQTISPTAFQRQINEVRPFFTQGQNAFFSTPYCAVCNEMDEWYTPNIPTPREGYAVEGQRGGFTYTGLEAVGVNRTDNAAAVAYVSPNQQNIVNLRHIEVLRPNFRDTLGTVILTHDNLKNFFTYVRYGGDSGTNVLVGNQGKRYELGAGVYSPTSYLYGVIRKVGAYFNPIDSVIPHSDIAGYGLQFNKQFKYRASAPIKEFDIGGLLDRYHGHTGALNQTDTNLSVAITTKNQWNVAVTAGSAFVDFSSGSLAPANQQGAKITYDFGSATPTFISFNTGRFGPGRLNTWARSSTMRLGARGSLTLEADNTSQYLDNGGRAVQWLERVGFAYQAGQNASLAIGLRRIIGTAPQLFTKQSFQNGSNVSFAYYRKVHGGEIYAVYGDSAAFSTVPQFIVKFIRYVGADKGT